MRKVIVSEYVSLDGVVEEPAWTMPYWNDEIARFKFDELFASNALLLGRVTYQGLAIDDGSRGLCRPDEQPAQVRCFNNPARG